MYSSMEFHPVLHCLLLRTGWWGGFLLDRQNLLSVTEIICWWSLSDFFFVHYLIWIYFIDVPDQYSQKSTPYLFQNNVALYLEPYWKQDNADIKLWYFIKFKWLTFPMEKATNFATDQVKGHDFKNWTGDWRWQWHMAVKRRIKHNIQALEL